MKQIRLVPLEQMLRRPQHCKCTWCEYGIDPAPQAICRVCYQSFKALLCATRWRNLRSARLTSIDTANCCNPFNFHPSGMFVVGEVIDHIKPWSFYPSLFWEWENLQTLCVNCHGHKTNIDGSRT